MGFSTYIQITNGTGNSANTLNGRGNLPALSTISATSGPEGVNTPGVRLDPTTTAALTCYAIGFYVTQSLYNGGPTYVTDGNGIFTGTNAGTTFPAKLYYNANYGSNTLNYTLCATGQNCASGAQICTLVWDLSSTALSGTSAGTTIPISLLNNQYDLDGNGTYSPVVTANTTVYCLNTPFPSDNPVYICQDEFSRIQQFLG
jgi:hypothetical protein